MKLTTYSFGTGDRFARQGKAQLKSILKAKERGVHISPVWNKSYREHQIIGTSPEEVRCEADQAVADAGWNDPYFVDADHIGMENVDYFLEYSNFFTIDVADYIGTSAGEAKVDAFIRKHKSLIGSVQIEGIDKPFKISEEKMRRVASDFLRAIEEVDKVYRHVLDKKEEIPVFEVSMDEVENPQTPVELLLILRMLADRDIKLDTIALKFSGRFNKGVDYVGDVDKFAKEFEQDLLVIDHAVQEFGLPSQLKLSVHSGSDKFSLYKPMHDLIKKHDKGLHLKTAGTTWLEELIGLSLAGDGAVQIVKDIYREALERYDELTGPYETVIDISTPELPSAEEVDRWDGRQVANALRHNPAHPEFDSNFRQLLHCAYKIAGEKGSEFTDALEGHADIIGENVTENLFERHITPLFIGK
ncbi:tagaturonate epimerase family protein [Aliifodinibius sp. S!AR15-10]|uniref:tagaturonate epimerase family protein n=1 Tax=Aliifodinibius sp. S!AR15-10 TaxID=2950437 RepID=UPI0028607930|nr:tagaturonate epimerase family protein [Aliifodinibius sp. S!AR15-10]MDR8394609.1 tagaturonate epimerase family protein [Aliifodinibius sp. S!AR15-10]